MYNSKSKSECEDCCCFKFYSLLWVSRYLYMCKGCSRREEGHIQATYQMSWFSIMAFPAIYIFFYCIFIWFSAISLVFDSFSNQLIHNWMVLSFVNLCFHDDCDCLLSSCSKLLRVIKSKERDLSIISEGAWLFFSYLVFLLDGN